jgi:tetratricopeptide (TPR) repeat protein
LFSSTSPLGQPEFRSKIEPEVNVDYQEYVQKSSQAVSLVNAARLKEAVDAIYQLILSDISDIDKANWCIEMAGVYDRQGNTEEALGWFDKGIAYEQVHFRYEVTEKKAIYLSGLGMFQEAIKTYEALLKQPFLSEKERDRLRKTLQALLGKSLGTWR